MADHFSGPRAISDPASDIADVYTFPSPERPGHLALVMDVFPAATLAALFSDALSLDPPPGLSPEACRNSRSAL